MELAEFMRDIRIRYKQTALAAAWSMIQPFFMMLIFTVFFGRLAGLNVADPNMEWNRWFSQLPPWGDYGIQELFIFRKL